MAISNEPSLRVMKLSTCTVKFKNTIVAIARYIRITIKHWIA